MKWCLCFCRWRSFLSVSFQFKQTVAAAGKLKLMFKITFFKILFKIACRSRVRRRERKKRKLKRQLLYLCAYWFKFWTSNYYLRHFHLIGCMWTYDLIGNNLYTLLSHLWETWERCEAQISRDAETRTHLILFTVGLLLSAGALFLW